MFSSVAISNFRSFRRLKMDGLRRVNLISGLNNCGKTTLLEALFIHCGGLNVQTAMAVDVFRGISRFRLGRGDDEATPYDFIFHNLDRDLPVRIESMRSNGDEAFSQVEVLRDAAELSVVKQALNGHGDAIELFPSSSSTQGLSKQAKVLKLTFRSNRNEAESKAYLVLDVGGRKHTVPDPIPAPTENCYMDPAMRLESHSQEVIELFGKIAKKRLTEHLVVPLREIEPHLQKIESIMEAGSGMLLCDLGDNEPLQPIALMGQGFIRFAGMLLRILDAPGGVVLIDEIENGLHYSKLVGAWKAIDLASRKSGVQIFATTHSWECITAAHEAFSGAGEYEFAYHRLDRSGDLIRTQTYDREVLQAAVESGIEVR